MTKALVVVVAVVTLSYAAWCSLACPLTSTLSHDEDQFMASAAMVAREGMQPYRDFAYLQMPNLVYVHALLYTTGHPFFAARLLSGACGFGICLIIFLVTRSLFRSLGKLSATLVAASVTLLLVTAAAFQSICSKAWNHGSANLCALLAFLAHSKAMRDNKRIYFLWSGLALGMAFGIRLTFAPLMAPFVLAVLFVKASSWKTKIQSIALFVGGAALSNLPAIYFCLTNYRDFVFGTFTYRILDPRYLWSYPRPTAAMPFQEKLRSSFFWTFGDYGAAVIGLLTGLGLIFLIRAIVTRRTKLRMEVVFLTSLFPFLLFGYLSPTPSQFAYTFMFLPFFLLLGVHAFSCAKIDNRILALGALVFLLVDAVPIQKSYGICRNALKTWRWVPLDVERNARWIRAQIPAETHGKILTLSPIFAIEAGFPIYREFVTGSFAWRVSHLVAPEEAAARKFPWSPGIREFLQKDPPIAVLTGLELRKDLENPIIDTLMSMGYEPAIAPNCGYLWQRPSSRE